MSQKRDAIPSSSGEHPTIVRYEESLRAIANLGASLKTDQADRSALEDTIRKACESRGIRVRSVRCFWTWQVDVLFQAPNGEQVKIVGRIDPRDKSEDEIAKLLYDSVVSRLAAWQEANP